MSALSMLLCLTMLVGSTFAWFTDTVTAGKNKIVAGNLDVELEYFDGYEKNEDGTNKKDTEGNDIEVWKPVKADTNLFKPADEITTGENGEEIKTPLTRWEPGHTEYVRLRIRNAGTLALKYKFNLSVFGEDDGETPEKEYTSVLKEGDNNKKFKLSNYLVFNKVNADVLDEKDFERSKLWKNDGEESMGDLSALTIGGDDAWLAPANKPMKDDKGNTIVGDTEEFVLAVYMPTSVGNEANQLTSKRDTEGEPTIYLGLTLIATQKDYEEDSFDNEYDEKAAYPGDVINVAQLEEALNNPNVKNVSVGSNITTTMSISSKKEVELNGNEINQYGNVVTVKNGADVTIKGGTIKDVGSSKAVDIEFGSNVTFENVTFDMTTEQLKNSSAPAYTAVGVRASAAAPTTVTFKNCTFKNQGVEFGGMNGASEINVKFENCTFDAITKVDGDKSISTLSTLISLDSNYLCGNVEIIGCTFNFSGFLRYDSWKAYAISAYGCRVDASKKLTLTLKGNTFNLKDASAGNELSATEHNGLVVIKDF